MQHENPSPDEAEAGLQPVSGTGSDSSSPPPRRSFLYRCITVAIGGFLSLFPLATGLFVFLDPLRSRKGESDGSLGESASGIEGFIRVAELDSLPDNGTPVPFQIRADHVDAWTMFRDVPVGTVYLRKAEDKSVVAFNVTCPHAGCSVDYVSDNGYFLCPCHDSVFQTDGSRSAQSPSARDLDRLDVKVEGNHVWVKYQNFRPGIAEKIVEA